ncbi:VWA domain-containing protein [Carboxydochorda subterranea]|uniref:VWA domain-containing protein n=1 Tax=Carboxydichorda subterranea TaxID=3109565 RepID=A0ABZ1BVU3_9FIRM|nr:VWA domain-containing protein [Limnochorda sp. L945t]WRP16713.1 VWA domain-containing protein [Limnochorda sp. L945t]
MNQPPGSWSLTLGAPAWLAAALGGALVILLLHMVRPRPRTVPVSSLLLWKLLEQQVRHEAPLRRLLPHLLMWLQMVALLLLGLALSRPIARVSSTGPEVGVLWVDRSASMQAEEGGQSRFAMAIRALAEAAGQEEARGIREWWAGGVGPGQATLLGPARSPQEARDLLRRIPPPSDGEASFKRALSALAGLKARGRSVFVWLATDGVMDDRSRTGLEELARSVPLRVLPVGDGPLPNVAVTALEAHRSGPDPGQADVMVEVTNFGRAPARAALSVQGDFGVQRRETLTLEPGQAWRTVFAYQVRGLGSLEARIQTQGPDALAVDDARTLVFGDPAQPALVCVRGSPYAPLRHALAAAGNVAVVWDPGGAVAPPAAAPDASCGRVRAPDLVVFRGTEPPASSSGAWRAPLWWVMPQAVPGDGPPVREQAPWEPVLFWQKSHPLLRFVPLDGVWIRRSPAAAPPPPSAEVLAETAAGPAMWEWTDEKSGQRRVETAFALEDSNLAEHVAFPVLVANVIRDAAPGLWEPVQPSVGAGRPVSLWLPPGEKLLLVAPDGQVSPWEPAASDAAFEATERAGVYSLWPAGQPSTNPVAMWAVQPAGPAESDLSGRNLPPLDTPAPAAGSARELPLWPYAATAAAAAMAGEAALHWMLARLPGRAGAGGALAAAWRRSLALRSIAVAAALAALSGLMVPWPPAGRRWVFVVDRSASVPEDARREIDAFLREALRHLGRSDRAWIVEAGATPRLAGVYRGGRPDLPRRPTGDSGLDPSDTDLEAALAAARSLLADTGGPAGGRIVLISDGRQTRGDVTRQARATDGEQAPGAQEVRVPIDVLPVVARPAPDVAVAGIEVPDVPPGHGPVPVRARLYASQAQLARVTLSRNGEELWRGEVHLPGGWSAFRYDDRSPLPDGRMAVYSLAVESAGPDAVPENDRASVAISPRRPGRILWVTGSDGQGTAPAGATWIEQAGLEVDRAPAGALPAQAARLGSYAAVVLDNVAASSMSTEQMRALASFVRDSGGGLVVTGGPASYGPGGYLGTPLDDVLPVRSEVPRRLVVPRVALVLVIDKSGSMSERDAWGTKLDAARRAAAAAIELLTPEDRVGLLAFDSEPRWLAPLEQLRDPAPLLAGLSRLAADGGTELGPALQEALRALAGTRAMVRHAIVLSDGKSTAADFEAMARRAAAEGITISTVAIGPDADAALLADLARWGHGRFYLTRQLQRLPQIFASETLTVTRSAMVTTPVVPVWTPEGRQDGEDGPIPADPASELPALGGYVATTPRPAARVLLASPEGDPVLATWRIGLGRVVAFTSSLTGPWGYQWQRSGLARRSLVRMVRWVMPAQGPGTFTVLADWEADRVRLALDAVGEHGLPLNFLPVTATLIGPSGTPSPSIPMAQEAPGRYAGWFVASEPGGYLVTLRAGDETLHATLVRGYPAEYAPGMPSPSLLARLARDSGGRVLGYVRGAPGPSGRHAAQDAEPSPAPPELTPELARAATSLGRLALSRPGTWAEAPAWPLLLVAAGLLLIADVAVRRWWGESPLAIARELVLGGARRLSAAARAIGGAGETVRRVREQALARRSGASGSAPGRASPAGDGVDPTQAARIYLARLRKERRPR